MAMPQRDVALSRPIWRSHNSIANEVSDPDDRLDHAQHFFAETVALGWNMFVLCPHGDPLRAP